MDYLVQFFAWLMDWCHSWCPNWWADIVIFTFFTKILQFPVSLWCQVNSLKMVSLMPEEIRIKIDRYGDKDAIGEATAAMYKREHYHPLLSLVPLAINIVILMAFVKVIYGIGASAGDSSSFTFTSHLHLRISDVPIRDGGISWLMPLFAGAAAWLLGYSQNIFNPLQHEQTRAQQLTTNGISICISLFLGMFVAAGVGLYWATSNVFSIVVQWGENLCIPPKSRVNYPVLRRAQAEWKKFEASLRKGDVSKEDRKREKADYKRFFKVANKHVVFYAEGGGYYKYFQSVIEWLLAHSNVVIHYVTNDPKDAIFKKVGGESRSTADVGSDSKKVGGESRSTADVGSDSEKVGGESRSTADVGSDSKKVGGESRSTSDVGSDSEKVGGESRSTADVGSDSEKVGGESRSTADDRSCKKGEGVHCPPTLSTYSLNARIRPYYIGPTKIIPLMMKMDADMVVMTTPDLNTFHIKRSYVKKDVEYVYLDHGPTSVHMCYRKGAFDHFDTIMCNGPFQVAEHRATEKAYGLKEKKLVESGYPLLDTLPREKVGGESRSTVDDRFSQKDENIHCPPTLSTYSLNPRIMIANSHQKDNVFDACLDDLIAAIAAIGQRSEVGVQTEDDQFHCLTSDLQPQTSEPEPLTIVLRPHPQYVRRFPARWQAIKEKYGRSPVDAKSVRVNIIFEDDFSKPSTMDQSDVLVTDWSGIAYEFAYKTRRPTLFVNTPMKVINPEWKKIDLVPTDISFRDEVGVSVACGALGDRALPAGGEAGAGGFRLDCKATTAALTDMLAHPDAFAAKIDAMFEKNFFNPGHAGEAVGGYILDSLIARRKRAKATA